MINLLEGGADKLIDKLKGEQEIVILGADRVAQDTYDLLMSRGIDICCFTGESRL